MFFNVRENQQAQGQAKDKGKVLFLVLASFIVLESRPFSR